VGLTIAGSGAGVTFVLAPPGEDGAVATGPLALSGLTLVTGPARSALKVAGGAVTLEDVALVGGASGAFVDGGSLRGRGAWLEGRYGLLLRDGEVDLAGVTARGGNAGVAQLGGRLTLTNGEVTGPSSEAAISLGGGTANLSRLVVRDGGPSGVAVSGGELRGRDLAITGARESGGIGGDCLLVLRGRVTLGTSELSGCGGAAVEAARSEVRLVAVDASGGAAGGLIFTGGTRAELEGTLVTGHGPGLVATQGSTVTGWAARFWTDPAQWIDCASGARSVALDRPGERQPCTPAPTPATPVPDAGLPRKREP
jgi:hypothetical protein